MFPVGIIGRRVTTLFSPRDRLLVVAAEILVQRWIRDDRMATDSPEMVTV